MSSVNQTEFKSIRGRVYSLEKRLLAFEGTALAMFQDISSALNLPSDANASTTLKTPAEIIQVLRARHPDLATHPTLWRDLEQALTDERCSFNEASE